MVLRSEAGTPPILALLPATETGECEGQDRGGYKCKYKKNIHINKRKLEFYQHRPQIAWKGISDFPQFASNRFTRYIFFYRNISGKETNQNRDTSRAGQAGGGSSKREKNYKPKRDFAYRIVCNNLDWLNLFSDDSNKVGICWFCRSTQLLARQDLAASKYHFFQARSSPTHRWVVRGQVLTAQPSKACLTKLRSPVSRTLCLLITMLWQLTGSLGNFW